MDASWYFSTDWGRDQRLRSEIEAQAAHTAQSSARLRSQLTKMQGSLERRINALAKAFDAYVELGDVREQLSELPSSAPVRRRARDAMATLRAGHNPTPLPEGQAGHWLGGAMNRVIAAVRRDVPLPDPGRLSDPAATADRTDNGSGTGESDGESVFGGGFDGFGAGDRVLTGSRDARVFEALALGSLGYGDRAAAALPALLTTDGGFTIEQAVLFVAVMDGKYGPEVLPTLREVMRGNMARSDALDWTDWLRSQARTGRTQILEWVAAQTAPLSELPETDEGAQPIDGVMGYAPGGTSNRTLSGNDADIDEMIDGLVTEMVDEGSPLERELIHRAATLRGQIEDPDASAPTPRWDHDPVPVGQVVREAFEGAMAGTDEHRELFAWILPHLREPIEEALRPDEEKSAVVVKARTPGGSVEVGEDGPRSDQLERARATIAERYKRPPLNKGILLAAGMLAVVTVLAMIGLGPQWWVIGLLVVAVGLVGIAFWLVRPGDRAEQQAGENRAVDGEIESARERITTAVAERDAAHREHELLAERVREQLTEFERSMSGATVSGRG